MCPRAETRMPRARPDATATGHVPAPARSARISPPASKDRTRAGPPGAGACALTRDEEGPNPPAGAGVICLLDRSRERGVGEGWGADGGVVKPADPFVLADLVAAPVAKEAG